MKCLAASMKANSLLTRLTSKTKDKFEDLFTGYSKNEVITTFQAMLELLKYQYLCVTQENNFDKIIITLNPERTEVDLEQLDEYN